jgi:hypothetical protein
MNSFRHLRAKDVWLRKNGYTLPEICDRLKKGKTTVYYWIKNVPIIKQSIFISKCKKNIRLSCIRAGQAIRKKFKALRDSARDEALSDLREKFKNELFRDFIILYITEGYRRTKQCVSIGNSDPSIIKLAHYWIKLLSNKKIDYQLRVHEDHNIEETIKFWATYLNVNEKSINCTIKKNSCKMKTRNWRNEYGIITLRVNDTYFRVKLDVYMDHLRKQWEANR